MDVKIFWQRIKTLLKSTKTTQKELAAYVGIPYRTLENWMGRGILPLIHEGYRMAKFFNVSVDFLVTGREPKKQTEITAIRTLLTRAGEKLLKLQ